MHQSYSFSFTDLLSVLKVPLERFTGLWLNNFIFIASQLVGFNTHSSSDGCIFNQIIPIPFSLTPPSSRLVLRRRDTFSLPLFFLNNIPSLKTLSRLKRLVFPLSQFSRQLAHISVLILIY